MFKSMAEFKAKNAAEGLHFFDRDTMRYWKSRVESSLIGGRYFITSEEKWKFNEHAKPERKYTVRETKPDGRVTTLKSHIATLEDAREWLKDYRKGLRNS